jgi:catechol 2,3-dioxygenase-like lactoylglutathione lyase family enzyme
MALRIGSVTFDCDDPRVMADFWAATLGYVPSGEPGEEVAVVEDPRNRDVELVFVRVPESKTMKNRVHLDIGADDMEAEVQRLVGLGAERGDRIKNWTVMRDPEGNEFCVIQVSKDDPVETWRT